MNTDEVIKTLRDINLRYLSGRVWEHAAELGMMLGEAAGYWGMLMSHYAEFISKYRAKEEQVIREEMAVKEEVESTGKKYTQTEVDRRIDMRMKDLKAKRERLETECDKWKTLLSTWQSRLRDANEEAKGTR